MAEQVPPNDIAELFQPRENATFRLLRRRGSYSLWRSKTIKHEVLGGMRSARVHYHVAVDQEAQVVLMPRFATAVLNFDLLVQGVSHG